MNYSCWVYLMLVLFLLSSCKTTYPAVHTDLQNNSVDYKSLDNWAAHPDKNDPADRVPDSRNNSNVESNTDVFFIHPTTYTSYKGNLNWNASLDDTSLNEITDNGTILYQASSFNSAGRVYAPRYRQAHIESFYTYDRKEGNRALINAYADVKTAFEYYLKTENKGRNILIASHSQGTVHAKLLIKEFFDNNIVLKDRLVAAYLIGMPVNLDEFKNIKSCKTASEVNCFISWRTFRKDYSPGDIPFGDSIAVTNPLSWTTDEQYIDKSYNKGAILKKFDKVFSQLVDAQAKDGLLYVTKPKFPGSFLFTRKNYHIADINFFYFNVKENAAHRVGIFEEGSE